MRNLQRFLVWVGIVGALQFFVLTTLAMRVYPGGTIHDRSHAGYSFWHNYFSDLGRRRSWNGASNHLSNLLFDNSLLLVGISLILFFISLPGIFKNPAARQWAVLAAVAGVVSALCYIGIAHNPLDVHYYIHTIYVRAGFIAFLGMSFFYLRAIREEPAYPNRYANAFAFFAIVLFIQIAIMLLGPRSFTSPFALFLQASAQKVVVYAEMLCMVYQCRGALKVLNYE